MQSSSVEIRTADGDANAYLTRPDHGRHPGVLLIMDAFGLRERIEEMADRVADRGYTVLAPNVFYRAGRSPLTAMPDLNNPDARGKFMQVIRPMIGQLTPERIAADGRAYLQYLDEVAPGPVAVVGYCLGGRLAWRIAAAYPDRVAALAGFHTGGLVTDDPDSPHLLASLLKAEVYLGHADADPNMDPEQIATLDRALEEASVEHRAEIYNGARHGYTMSDTPVYDEAAAERHFRELFALLERTLTSDPVQSG